MMSPSTLLTAAAATVAVAGSAMSRARGSITVITMTATTCSGSTLVRKLAHWFGTSRAVATQENKKTKKNTSQKSKN